MYEKPETVSEPAYKSAPSHIKPIPAAPGPPHGLNQRSCGTCRRRKVKCDKREGGCSNCTRSNIECFYPGPGRAPRRTKTGKRVNERETELLKRLRRLEGVVEELSGQVEIDGVRASPTSLKKPKDFNGVSGRDSAGWNTVRVVGMDEDCAPLKTDTIISELGKLVIDEGKSRYVGNAFWAKLSGEMDNMQEMLEESDAPSEDDEEGNSPNASMSPDFGDHQSFIMGYATSNVDLRSLHPLPSQIPFYWETFATNVDPICKLMHIPTMAQTMKKVKHNLDYLSRSTEALCFAIYFAAITSMSPDEVQLNFETDKTALLKRYRFATEQALARANFLTTSEIVTVQAFVLFLACVRRSDESRFVWTLTGLVIRISMSLGLHRDGSKLGLKPFDTEMRRRCWWQIVALENKSSEDYGTDPTIIDSSFDTEFPLNINDGDLDPNATEPPAPRTGISEITFCLIRYEICSTARRLSYVPPGNSPCREKATTLSLADKEKLVRDLHERLEAKYLIYCKDAGPLYWAAATVSRLIVAKMGLMIYMSVPGLIDELPMSIRDRLFAASIEIMEYHHLLENESSTKQWGWLFHTYTQWHAIVYILREVCTRPNCEMVERGWRAVDGVFDTWQDAVKHTKNGMLWAPMRSLMARARKKREADIQERSNPIPTEFFAHSTIDAAGATPNPNPQVGEVRYLGLGLDPIRPLQQSLQANEYPALQLDGNGYAALQTPGLQMVLQSQYQPHGTPWILDDSALVDLDMNAVEGDVSWEGWDDLVRDFPTTLPDAAVPSVIDPTVGGMGTWW